MLAFGFIGGYEMILLLVIAVLLFSPRIPAAVRSLAQGLVEFKRALLPAADDNGVTPADSDRNPHA
ncbi:MAG: twin-arginine translocase TatA/TatE family subunit [Phycisphaeraceae bacterium]|nr:twin-arginine translocase TatA/TatE family subunit [Phycisphaeraceae bacterium]